MSGSLLDVNVLIALLDANHQHHEIATTWVSAKPNRPAVCPLTLNGCARILGRADYPDGPGSVATALQRLHLMAQSLEAVFWPDDLSLLDAGCFRWTQILRPQDITDIYLLALAVGRQGRLVTFDRDIQLGAVAGATKNHLVCLG